MEIAMTALTPPEHALRPCPFCDGKSDWDSKPGATGEQFWCMCVNDECVFYAAHPFHTYATKAEAIAAWNRRPAVSEADVERVAAQFTAKLVQDVCELPDRTSPDDWPEAMLVTGEELHAMVKETIRAAIAALNHENPPTKGTKP